MLRNRRPFQFALASQLTKAASFSLAPVKLGLDSYTELVITLTITAAERDSADETYDLYITTGDGAAAWDMVHFPQVATTGAKTFVAKLQSQAALPQNVTTAAPGVAATESGTLAVVAGGTNATKSLGVGLVRQGPWGSHIGYELVIAGTVVTGLSYSISVSAR